MALNYFKYNHLMPLHFKGLNGKTEELTAFSRTKSGRYMVHSRGYLHKYTTPNVTQNATKALCIIKPVHFIVRPHKARKTACKGLP